MLCAAAIGLLGPNSASAAVVPDASCPGPAALDAPFPGDYRSSQTFTAQNSGPLTTAQVLVNKSGTPGDWVVSINAVDAGAPTDTVLASATIPDASVPDGDDSLLTANFAEPHAVTAGQQYAVVVTRPDSDSLGIPYHFDNPCPGVNYDSFGQTAAWQECAQCDLVFAVFVTVPDQPPEPEPEPVDTTPPDTTPPDTTITAGPPPKTKQKTATFTFNGTDARAVSGFQCKLDSGAFATCASPFTVKVKKGKHTFQVQATDAAGNADPTPATDAWTVKKKKKKK